LCAVSGLYERGKTEFFKMGHKIRTEFRLSIQSRLNKVLEGLDPRLGRFLYLYNRVNELDVQLQRAEIQLDRAQENRDLGDDDKISSLLERADESEAQFKEALWNFQEFARTLYLEPRP